MNRYARFFLAFVFAVGLFAPGCGKKDNSTIHLAQFLTDPVLIEKLHLVVADIEKRHPGLHVQIDNIPYNEYQEKVTTQMAGGNAPDVVYVEVNNFVDLYLRGVFEDLTPYVQKDGVDLTAYYPGVLGRFSPGGKVYALPQDTAPTGLVFYNRKMFRDAGLPYPDGSWTWPGDFLSICQKLTKRDAAGKVTQWGFIDAYDIQFENFVFSNGANWVDDVDHPTRFTLDDPKAMEAVQFRYDLIQKYHVSPDPSQIQAFNFSSGQMQMFINGQVAMLSSGIWQTPGFLLAKDLDFDVTTFPAGPQGIKGWGSGGSGYALSKSSSNKDLAWIVIKELTSEASVSQLASTGMIQPALMKLAQSDVFLKAPGAAHKAILLDMPRYSHYEPFMPNWTELFYGVLGPAMDQVWLGEKKPGDVLPDITKRINEKFFKK
ncbi:MAG TPA: sugar ABC transporter substrate-binding protein [bacterium]|jgi:multiple sugar transport system substrate-binding protein|nr:sugar ABC transporter substrate-binding protein [bacterium]